MSGFPRFVAGLVAVTVAADVLAQGWTTSRVADTSTQSPGGPVFGGNGGATFTNACLGSNLEVAFFGVVPVVGRGIYAGHENSLAQIADRNSPVPGVVGATFDQGFGSLSYDGGAVTFDGRSTDAGSGIYAGSGGPLQAIANRSTAVPGGSGTFSGAVAGYRDGGSVAFAGIQAGTVRGQYRWTSGAVNTIVDVNTPIPGGSGNFANWGSVALTGSRFAFSGRNSSHSGVYSRDAGGAGPLSVIADSATPTPGGSGFLNDFSWISADGTNTAFAARADVNTGNSLGIYAHIDNQLLRIADTTTAGPSGELFVNFQSVTISGRNVAFVALANNGLTELIVWRDGVLSRVAKTGDFVNGIRLEKIEITSQALRGDSIAFTSYHFVGAPQEPDYGGVYTAAYVPSPGAAAILVGAWFCSFKRRRRA